MWYGSTERKGVALLAGLLVAVSIPVATRGADEADECRDDAILVMGASG